MKKTKKPVLEQTELERVIAAQEDAAAEAKRAELAAQRAELYAKREAEIAAMRRPEIQKAAAPTPAQKVAATIRQALGDDWSEFVTWLRSARVTDLKDALLFIEGTEEGIRHHASVMQSVVDRAAIQEAETAARAARRERVIAGVTPDEDAA